MNPETQPTDLTGVILEQLPIAKLPGEKRSRAIREIVSLAMEDPLDPAPLTPMPVPAAYTTTDDCRVDQANSALTPLPAPEAPFVTCKE